MIGASYFCTPSLDPFYQKIFTSQTAYKLEHHLFSGSVPVDIAGVNKVEDSRIDTSDHISIDSSDIIEI